MTCVLEKLYKRVRNKNPQAYKKLIVYNRPSLTAFA